MIGVFNRSYYEEVLVVRVHPEILEAQQSPSSGSKDSFWQERFESINDHELHLRRNGTRIIKFFLHISKKEQRKRLLSRIDDPDKRWKFSPDDLVERALWDDYMQAYAGCLRRRAQRKRPGTGPGRRQEERAADRLPGHLEHARVAAAGVPYRLAGAREGATRGAREAGEELASGPQRRRASSP